MAVQPVWFPPPGGRWCWWPGCHLNHTHAWVLPPVRATRIVLYNPIRAQAPMRTEPSRVLPAGPSPTSTEVAFPTHSPLPIHPQDAQGALRAVFALLARASPL